MKLLTFIFFFGCLNITFVGGQTTNNKHSHLSKTELVTLTVAFEEQLDSCLVDDNAELTAHVTIHNNSDSSIYFYENWNSYGYYNFTFELETEDSTYLLRRAKTLWYRNFPSYTCVAPFDSLQFDFILIDSLTAMDRGENGWVGFPTHPTEFGYIRAKYTLNKDDAILAVRDLSKVDYSKYFEDLDSQQASNHINSQNEYKNLSIFSLTLISEKKWIQFHFDN